MTRPTGGACEYPLCGTPLLQAQRGQPRRFCCDEHRRLAGYLRAIADSAGALQVEGLVCRDTRTGRVRTVPVL